MGFSKENLISRLKELGIRFQQYEHPVVLTVEAQAKYVGDKGGALSKNLFLKDKKNRYYIVSALAETKVDMKVLSQRLGLGKGGIRMAPEEALGEILQVPLGCVTPFALINESARNVSLLLDKGFKTWEHCFFHPLSNDMSIAINSRDLDKFLGSIGISPAYVDLEDNPPVGKDQPPDLAAFVPSSSTILSDSLEKAADAQVPVQNPVSTDLKPAAAKAKILAKASDAAQNHKDKLANNVQQQPNPFSNTGLLVKETINKISALVLSEITEETIKKHGSNLGVVVEESFRKHLCSEMESSITMLKNIAYTEGFHAGLQSGSSKRLFSCP